MDIGTLVLKRIKTVAERRCYRSHLNARHDSAIRRTAARRSFYLLSLSEINKLKLVKRQMYGRAKIDLLQERLIGAP